MAYKGYSNKIEESCIKKSKPKPSVNDWYGGKEGELSLALYGKFSSCEGSHS